MMYQLEKYRNTSSRHVCPNCGDRHSFTYYVDEDGMMLDERVGRCDHESGCGYHYTPRQFFQDNPNRQQPKTLAFVSVAHQQPKEPDFIFFDMMWATCRNGVGKNELMFFMWRLFDKDKRSWSDCVTKRLSEEYGVGTYSDGAAIFWQVDALGRVRTGKIMRYKPNGHRIKDAGGVDWVHSRMKRKGLLADGFNLVQCLFGENLLTKYPSKKVVVVESEKTALLGSAYFADFVWVATGGKSSSIIEKCKVLKGRHVILFPDVDGFADWKEKARLMTFCASVTVSDFLMKKTSSELEAVAAVSETSDTGKIDIGDWIIYEVKTKARDRLSTSKETTEVLGRMMSENPNVVALINGLNLTAKIN